MRIAIIAPPLTISGGGQRQVLELAHWLWRLGHEVDVFSSAIDKDVCYPEMINWLSCFETWLSSKHAPLSTDSFFIKILKFIKNLYLDFSDIFLLSKKIRSIDIEKKYDILNFHDDSLYVSFFFRKGRNVWMMNDFPGILDSEVKWLLVPISVATKAYLWLTKFFFKIFCNKMRTIVVLDFMNRAALEKMTWKNATVIRSGINLSNFSSECDSGDYEKGYVFQILSTSIFFRHRRYEDAIDAIGILVDKWIRNFKYDIIGRHDTDPAYYDEIKRTVERKGLCQYVTFLGWVPESDLKKAYSRADIFLFTNAPQTWWLAVFEAMASWCAVILTDGCWAHEVLTDGYDACIVPSKSPIFIAEKLELMMTIPPFLREISKNGKTTVKDIISWDKYAKNMESAFMESLKTS